MGIQRSWQRVCMACKRSRVRISLSPPCFALTSYAWHASAKVDRQSEACPAQPSGEARAVNKLILISYHPKKMHCTYILKSISNPNKSQINLFYKILKCLLRYKKNKTKINLISFYIAGQSSPVACQAHNLKVVGSNPAPATKIKNP